MEVVVREGWVKSTRCSGGECVEVALSSPWTKPGRCDGGQCVEVATVGTVQPTILVRNSKHPETVVSFDSDEWAAFIAGVENGEFRY